METATKKRMQDDSVVAAALNKNDACTPVQLLTSATCTSDKRTKLSNSNNDILTLLDENSLLQVLLRTNSNDHDALWHTCRRFRRVIDSQLFRQERAQQEWAQVETTVLTAADLYRQQNSEVDPEESSWFRDNYGELGYIPVNGAIQNDFRILVDGKIGGSGSFTLIERSKRRNFHATCDAIPQEVQGTGYLFFDRKGRPRLQSLKEAMAASPSTGSSSSTDNNEHQKDYVLYLDTFKLNPEHRWNNSTWVGAKAIRSLLLDSPLKDKWSVVIYIADAKANFTEQDETRARQQDRFQHDLVFARALRPNEENEPDEQTLREESDWKERFQSLAKYDLRQFLRAGFQQATDSLQKSNCLYAFTVPTFVGNPMLSHEASLAMNIAGKKEQSVDQDNALSIVDSELLRFMVRACAEREDLCGTTENKQATPPPSREQVSLHLNNKLDEFSRSINTTEQEYEQDHQKYVGSIMEQMEEIEGRMSRMEDLQRSRMEDFNESDMAKLREAMSTQEERMSRQEECAESQRGKIANLKGNLESTRSQMVEEMLQRCLSAHAEAIRTAREDVERHDTKVKAEVGRLVGDGASVKNSNVLHACAANLTSEHIELLLDFVPVAERQAVLNKRDSSGLTPLMAAAVAPYVACSNPESRIQVAEKLIELGADKNITDVFGETALGKFRGMKRPITDFRDTFVWRLGFSEADLDREHARMEQLLRPIGGPTVADDSYLDDNDEDDDGSEIESDEDDGLDE